MRYHTFEGPLKIRHWPRAILSLCLVIPTLLATQAQDNRNPQNKPAPAQIKGSFVLAEGVLAEQWPASLGLVNAPRDLKQVEPGQCIRFGILASGDDSDRLLLSAKYSFELTLGGKTQSFGPEFPETVKQIKPEGGDFVTDALGVVGLKNPFPSGGALAASRAKWCAPVDAQDGTATLRGAALLTGRKSVTLPDRIFEVRTYTSKRQQEQFADSATLGSWVKTYYSAPEPALLLPAMQFVASNNESRSRPNVMAFFLAALKSDRTAAEELMRKLPSEDPPTQTYAIPILRSSGYPVAPLIGSIAESERSIVDHAEIPDPFDLTPDRALPSRMDMLWATFFATGRIEPVRAVVSMLAWRDDYDQFIKLRDSGQKPIELTDSIMRGISYAAAGWSLNAISRSDGLVADYLDALKASANTPASVKSELANLRTNPAFQRR